eukprot:1223352-Prymnesium_polylepis.1
MCCRSCSVCLHSSHVSAVPCAAVRVLSVYIHPYSYLISAAGKRDPTVSVRVAGCEREPTHHKWGGRVIRWKWGMTSHDA